MLIFDWRGWTSEINSALNRGTGQQVASKIRLREEGLKGARCKPRTPRSPSGASRARRAGAAPRRREGAVPAGPREPGGDRPSGAAESRKPPAPPPLHPRTPSLTAAVRDVPAAKALPLGPVQQPRALEEKRGGEDVSTQRGEHVERGRHPAALTGGPGPSCRGPLSLSQPAAGSRRGGAAAGRGGSEAAAALRERSRCARAAAPAPRGAQRAGAAAPRPSLPAPGREGLPAAAAAWRSLWG